jgi:hypothetical protein
MAKQPWEWGEDDIELLIRDGVKECFDLDYKESRALRPDDRSKMEISKDVAAFANSGGGTVVYGVAESGHVPTTIDDGIEPGGAVSKEWLENVITSRIHPKIEGVRIGEVDLRRTRPGRVLYVVHVPQSLRAPHQSADHRYYKRHNFKSEPMEDYEVRDVSRRAEAPMLSVKLVLAPRVPLGSQAEVRVLVANEGEQPAEYAFAKIGVDMRTKPSAYQQFSDSQTRTFAGTPLAVILHEFHVLWGRSSPCPIFRGVPVEVGRLLIELPASTLRFLARWEIHAPKMSPRTEFALGISEMVSAGSWSYGFESLGKSPDESVFQSIRDTEHLLRAPDA